MLKKKIEALLFYFGKIDIYKLANLLNTSPEVVEKKLEELKKDYKDRDSAIEIKKFGDTWEMTVGDIDLELEPDIPKPILKILSFIVYKAPIKQSEVVKKFGKNAYKYINYLETNNWIKKTKDKGTFVLEPTKKVFEYFEIDEKHLKELIRKSLKDKKDKN